MRFFLYWFFVLLTINTFGQKVTNLELRGQCNIRNASVDTIFDWYTKEELLITLDSVYKFYGMINNERENGVNYNSYEITFTSKYFKVDKFYDAEKDIDYISFSAYYSIFKYFKLGYDFSLIKKDENNNIYVSVNYKWIEIEIAFFQEVCRYKLKLIPEFKIKDKLKIGFDTNIIGLEDRVKWNTGLTINYKIK